MTVQSAPAATAQSLNREGPLEVVDEQVASTPLDLRAAAKARGCEHLVSLFADEEIEEMLQHRQGSVDHVLLGLRRNEELLGQLQSMEKQADMKKVESRLLAAHYFFGGYDACDRAIFWGKVLPDVRGLGKLQQTEPILVLFWVVLWVRANRQKHQRGITFIWTDRERGLLEFSLDYVRRVSEMLMTLACLFPFFGPVVVIGAKPSIRLLSGTFLSLCPDWKQWFRLAENEEEIRDIVGGRADLPEGFVSGGGERFLPNEKSLGCFENLLKRQGFTRMNVRSLLLPDKDDVPWVGQLEKTYGNVDPNGLYPDEVRPTATDDVWLPRSCSPLNVSPSSLPLIIEESSVDSGTCSRPNQSGALE